MSATTAPWWGVCSSAEEEEEDFEEEERNSWGRVDADGTSEEDTFFLPTGLITETLEDEHLNSPVHRRSKGWKDRKGQEQEEQQAGWEKKEVGGADPWGTLYFTNQRRRLGFSESDPEGRSTSPRQQIKTQRGGATDTESPSGGTPRWYSGFSAGQLLFSINPRTQNVNLNFPKANVIVSPNSSTVNSPTPTMPIFSGSPPSPSRFHYQVETLTPRNSPHSRSRSPFPLDSPHSLPPIEGEGKSFKGNSYPPSYMPAHPQSPKWQAYPLKKHRRSREEEKKKSQWKVKTKQEAPGGNQSQPFSPSEPESESDNSSIDFTCKLDGEKDLTDVNVVLKSEAVLSENSVEVGDSKIHEVEEQEGKTPFEPQLPTQTIEPVIMVAKAPDRGTKNQAERKEKRSPKQKKRSKTKSRSKSHKVTNDSADERNPFPVDGATPITLQLRPEGSTLLTGMGTEHSIEQSFAPLNNTITFSLWPLIPWKAFPYFLFFTLLYILACSLNPVHSWYSLFIGYLLLLIIQGLSVKYFIAKVNRRKEC